MKIANEIVIWTTLILATSWISCYTLCIVDIEYQVNKTDNEIDQLVYKLYNLTPAEITLIEQSLK